MTKINAKKHQAALDEIKKLNRALTYAAEAYEELFKAYNELYMTVNEAKIVLPTEQELRSLAK